MKKDYSKRFLAKIILEAVTPLSLGSGDINILTDAPVARDVNGLPYLPGTTISGILRHAIGEQNAQSFFGIQAKDKSGKGIGEGSKIIFSEGKIMDRNGLPVDGLQNIDWSNGYFSKFNNLPVRQHVRINSAGTAEKGAKFDEEVVYKGTRFCFEIEYVAEKGDNYTNFENVLKQLRSNSMRFGGGSRSGFGEIKIVEIKTRTINFENQEELNDYLEKSSSLNETTFWDKSSLFSDSKQDDQWHEYKLILKPEDFFLFSSGLSSDDADITPVFEDVIIWKDGHAQFEEQKILIPGSSVKGAISHRVAFHYNRLNKIYADQIETSRLADHVGKKNNAVKMLFGSEGEKDSETNKTINQQSGNVMISDIIFTETAPTKILNHICIDRFTGGAIDGMLFSEETVYGKGIPGFEIKLLVNKKVFNDEHDGQKIKEAFESALEDICAGMLPLGGGVNRGNGIFNGQLIKPE